MRASVGLLNRNIKIVRDLDHNQWGFGVFIYTWFNTIKPEEVFVGSSTIQGVQFVSGGQSNTSKAAFTINNTNAYPTKNRNTRIAASSFSDC